MKIEEGCKLEYSNCSSSV